MHGGIARAAAEVGHGRRPDGGGARHEGHGARWRQIGSQQCEDAFSTVFRQVAFNRFEEACHTARRKEGELSLDQLGEMYQAKLQPMFGDGLTLTDEHKGWWSYVGHFLFAPGYVYAYAFGNLLALSVYHRYLEVGPPFVDAVGASRKVRSPAVSGVPMLSSRSNVPSPFGKPAASNTFPVCWSIAG